MSFNHFGTNAQFRSKNAQVYLYLQLATARHMAQALLRDVNRDVKTGKAKNAMQTDFHEFLKTQRDYSYLQRCITELPSIDWLDFTAKMYRRNHKASTAIICAKSMHFLSESRKLKNQSLNTELQELIARQDLNLAYRLLDEFVSYCETVRSLSPGSTSVYVRGIRRVLRYAGVKIDSKEFIDRVIMPKPKPVRDEYPTDDQITLILNCASPNIRAFLMLLCDTGLGRSEAARLRTKDFYFNEDPIRIETERHKTGEQVETFCTRKTAEVIQQLVISKKLKEDDLIFLRSIGKRSADKLAEQYAKVLQKAGLDEKIEGHAYRKFHLHVYRKRWFTKAINVVPAYVAHAMLGRKQYLDQYLAHPLSDRQAFYKKIAKHVSVFENKADKAELLAEASKIAGIDLTAEKLEALRALTTHFAKLSVADLQQITRLLHQKK